MSPPPTPQWVCVVVCVIDRSSDGVVFRKAVNSENNENAAPVTGYDKEEIFKSRQTLSEQDIAVRTTNTRQQCLSVF